LGVVENQRIVEVLAETAGVLEQLAWRDLVSAGQVGEVVDDAGVEVEFAFYSSMRVTK